MPALRAAYRAIQGVDASQKHVIVLTDGQTPKDGYETLVGLHAQGRNHKRGETLSDLSLRTEPDQPRSSRPW